MGTTTRRRRGVKRQDADAANEAREIARDQLEELARQGARQILMAALQDERDLHLGRDQYERSGDASDGARPFCGYRNGSTPHRLTLGCGTVDPLAIEGMERIHAQLTQAGIEHVYWTLEGVAHTWVMWRTALYYEFLPRLWR